MKQGSIVERVIHRLVKKHISGPTMGSAIDRAKRFNEKGIPASITFISNNPQTKPKAAYITTTYMQLIREIARMGITASVHLQLDQLGAELSGDFAIKNLQSILEVSRKCGVFVWCEIKDHLRDAEVISRIDGAKGFGVALPNIEHGIEFARLHRHVRQLKVSCKEDHAENARLKDPLSGIETIAKSAGNLVLLSLKESDAAKLVRKNPKYRKSLIFEFQLGYGDRKIGRMMKKGARLSMFIPFGKDWESYAINNVPEGYTRLLANRLLAEGKAEGA